jgi:erythromycin esterase-like protein
MWGNWEVAALCEWLAEYNSLQPLQQKVGFYGLDVYSLWESIDAIMRYLKKTDKQALRKAQQAFDCFEPYRHDEGQTYAHASQLVPSLCENEVVELLKEIQARMPQYDSDYESAFSTHQNALVVMNAERYYRAMVQGGAHSWNIRDRHMEDTLTRLLDFHGEDSKAIIWAHNTHIGDARATDMTEDGMYNLGELARLEHADKGVVLVGFGSYQGSVVAARRWGATMKVTNVPEARKGSWEQLLHQALGSDSLLMMDDLMQDILLENHIDHRAIGVVYNPELEAYGNYVPTILPLRYDAFIHLDKTSALHAMHIKPDGQQVPETYPFGL